MIFKTDKTNIITVVFDDNNMNINIYGMYSSPDFVVIQKYTSIIYYRMIRIRENLRTPL